MGENRSLDDFLGGDGDADGAEATAETDESEATAETDESEATAETDESVAMAETDELGSPVDESDTEATTAIDDAGAAADADGTVDADDADDPGDADAMGADEGIEEPADAEPAAATYRWDPEGGACADCGATVERRWRDDGAFVCADCKEW